MTEQWSAGEAGPFLAILAMAAVTYVCRILGVVLMSRVPLTPRVRRGLAALPGSIIVATVLPLALRSGLPAALALVCAGLVMLWRRNELLALAVGLGVVTLARALGSMITAP
ncbi:AzlD domain-containing protein [Chelatococcus sp. SYSU_G07232]|uniref:AzlD domain-containing protein n=1 Tax=Chelatococcus albus TaxID=3047466 RepID=A0ABT7AG14_9HYPH|nr:AzlD domain-containing protein [Chelatococcus sp. SYSU_G07232]MDJ1157957.1 AzlD domain-containing protein [Chelatococcus sp. SYSU_G07232]